MIALLQSWRFRKRVCVAEIGPGTLKLSLFRKNRNGLQKLRQDTINISNDGFSSDMKEQLRPFVARWQLKCMPVVMSLSPEQLRFQLLPIPEGLRDGIANWLNTQKQKLIPAGMKPSEVLLSVRLFAGKSALVSLARYDVVAGWCDLLASLGLTVVRVAADMSPVLLGLDELNSETNACVVVLPGAATFDLFLLRDGCLLDYRRVFGTDANPDLTAAISTMFDKPGVKRPVLVLPATGSTAPELKQYLSKNFAGNQIKEFDPKMTAPGLAAQSLDAGHFELGLLPPARYEEVEKRQVQVQAVSLAVLLSTIFVSVLTILTLVLFIVKGQNRDWRQRAGELQNRISQIEHLRANGDQLRLELESQRAILAQRSRFAGVMQQLGTVMPDQVWLRQLNYSPGQELDESAVLNLLQIEGLATDESGPTQLLHKIEEATVFKDATLQFIKKAGANGSRKSAVNHGYLTFGLRAEIR